MVKRSLISSNAQALLFALVRNLKPEHVVEIGCVKGGTTEALARALDLNGSGTVHAVGPYDKELFGPACGNWPVELQRRAKYYKENSAAFFENLGAGASVPISRRPQQATELCTPNASFADSAKTSQSEIATSGKLQLDGDAGPKDIVFDNPAGAKTRSLSCRDMDLLGGAGRAPPGREPEVL